MRELRGQRQAARQPVIDFHQSRAEAARRPMDVMRTAISMLGLYDPDIGKEATPEINRRARSFDHGEDRRDRRVFSSRSQRQIALPPVRDDLTEARTFSLSDVRRTAIERSERHARRRLCLCTPITA